MVLILFLDWNILREIGARVSEVAAACIGVLPLIWIPVLKGDCLTLQAPEISFDGLLCGLP